MIIYGLTNLGQIQIITHKRKHFLIFFLFFLDIIQSDNNAFIRLQSLNVIHTNQHQTISSRFSSTQQKYIQQTVDSLLTHYSKTEDSFARGEWRTFCLTKLCGNWANRFSSSSEIIWNTKRIFISQFQYCLSRNLSIECSWSTILR